MNMRTWNDYKEHVAAVDPDIAKDIREAEAMSAIVKAMVEQLSLIHISEPTRRTPISYAVFCLKKKNNC